MSQLTFWNSDNNQFSPVVNVAQVPQRSPFRYPGGKTWLVPHIRAWLRSLKRHSTFVEPFLGGGIVSLTVAFEELADHVVMTELDSDVAALWETILSDDNDWLVERIRSFDMTLENLHRELAKTPVDKRTVGFHTLLRNRTCHGGILAAGSGLLKHGENGKGIKSRWYPETLAKRIQNIKLVRDRITFVNGDGLKTIRKYASDLNTIFFIDPPYTAAGKRAGTRLYTHCELNHKQLFEQCRKIKGDFLMTYDVAQELVEMAKQHGFKVDTVSMKNTHHSTMQELVIGKNLSWLN